MTELPDTNDGSGSASDKTQDKQDASIDLAAAAAGTTEEAANDSSASGKRDHDNGTASVGIMGGHSAKRGKREWLSFRGARHTRVGEEYQVASLPPVGGGTKADDTTNDKDKGN